MAELYEALGHDVLLEPVHGDELAASCMDCTLALNVFRTVYTRVKS
jgi:hypothetical protein